ncbi:MULTISPECIES: DegT/DnrJ/EryC1/StrS family aminotransferase [Pectobacterium]|uniref:Aminotransferase class I/II-fold pyridoxal phosphate-dependent enzyme n=1 Tax=Pectobacterium parvum TaxID=2778550 RepID=A0AAP9IF32_9GAMM|nr:MULTISPECIES: DegT/DnrJ/EryC1/StrS family aminotransferase [Pectobacterium]GKW40879.1 UDP-4-amino-4,6-dideoxy-N-acetyl-beta-L-altrosami ne transaminase [Pectobacterium carotovorum subsp. carotovorum]KFX10609.1 hypothetical protein KP17_18150 [Pectobacterium parvum]MCU1800694.1 DegT/DnrJ/EryC1/StrS family aminotransferase [Pectobacterium parvum]QHQ23231.1 aminotransferase class I/II-fold pyridoxal phosphate-dependent enzyme [Pectobacterium parvum]UVD97014.1 DegT/DnrJ/EryC1/StrS family aminot
MIKVSKQTISQRDENALIQALRDEFLTGGISVSKFEQRFASFVGCKEAIAVSSGTAALHLASIILGLKAGDAVFVPCNTFAATINSIIYVGATPIIVDVDLKDGNMCPQSLLDGIQLACNLKLNAKAVFVVHFAGHPANMISITEIAKQNGIDVVEDSCHALGAQVKSFQNSNFQHCGTQGDLAVWSFHPTKHITTGEGGMLTTNNSELASKARMYRNHGIFRDEGNQQKYPWLYDIKVIGHNFRMSDLNAALGISQLESIEDKLTRHRAVASMYHDFLKGFNLVEPLGEPQSERHKHAYHIFPVKIDFKGEGFFRGKLMSYLLGQGIQTQVHYIPLHFHSAYRAMSIPKVNLKNGEKLYTSILSLPMHEGVSDQDVVKVISLLEKGLKQC